MLHSAPSDVIEQEPEQSGSEDGVYLDDLADGAVLDVETKHHHYTIVKNAPTRALISGHPKYCPEPVTVEIDGSADKGVYPVKRGYIGRGMHLVFEHPVYHIVSTSRILDIRKVA